MKLVIDDSNLWNEFGGYQKVLKDLEKIPERCVSWLHKKPDGSCDWLLGDLVNDLIIAYAFNSF